MARAAFKCSKCDRTFSMKAHLARHMNTILRGLEERQLEVRDGTFGFFVR